MKISNFVLFVILLFSTNAVNSRDNLAVNDGFEEGIPLELFKYCVIPKDEPLLKLRFGILVGVSYYILDKKDYIEVSQGGQVRYRVNVKDADLGIHFGVMSQFHLSKLFLRPELVFNSNTINYEVVDIANSSAVTIAKEKYQNLDIPVLIGFDLGLLKIMAGPVGHIFINNKSDLIKLDNFTQTVKSITFGYQAGLGLDIGNFMVDLRYEGNLTKFGKGIRFSNEEFYFSKTPGRIIATFTFAIK